MSEKKSRQAGWLYTFFYPNRAYRYNEEQRKLKRKDDDLKLSRVFVLVYDIQSRDFQQACRNVMNDRRRAEQKSVEGFLPLHLALYERAPLQLLELLIDAYPAALKEYCPKNMLPLHIAARDHTILMVIMETIVRCYPPAVRVPDIIGDLPVQTSIRQRLPKEMTHLFLREYVLILIGLCYGYLKTPWLSYRGLLSSGALESQCRFSSVVSYNTQYH